MTLVRPPFCLADRREAARTSRVQSHDLPASGRDGSGPRSLMAGRASSMGEAAGSRRGRRIVVTVSALAESALRHCTPRSQPASPELGLFGDDCGDCGVRNSDARRCTTAPGIRRQDQKAEVGRTSFHRAKSLKRRAIPQLCEHPLSVTPEPLVIIPANAPEHKGPPACTFDSMRFCQPSLNLVLDYYGRMARSSAPNRSTRSRNFGRRQNGKERQT